LPGGLTMLWMCPAFCEHECHPARTQLGGAVTALSHGCSVIGRPPGSVGERGTVIVARSYSRVQGSSSRAGPAQAAFLSNRPEELKVQRGGQFRARRRSRQDSKTGGFCPKHVVLLTQ